MFKEELGEIRQYLHKHPEPSFEEFETADYICRFLDTNAIKYTRIETSVIARIDTGRNGKHIGFRADMDALCMEELSTVPYKSENPGVMHACGHDAHMTILLFAAKSIKENLEHYKGKFTFIFQHAEEIPPGGAKALVDSGVTEGLDVIYGLHCDPEVEVGYVTSKVGPLMAAVDKFNVKVIGKGGHGAMPHTCIDPIVLTSQIIVNLQTVVSRSTNPLEASLITIGMLHGGESFNVIPESVTFEGTVRTLSPEVRARTEQRIRQILDGMTAAYEGTYEIEWIKGYPVLMNDKNAVEAVEATAVKVLGEGHYIEKKDARLLGEDFASYLEKVPGAFFFLGTRSSEATAYPLHSPRFDIDEASLECGLNMLLGLAL